MARAVAPRPVTAAQLGGPAAGQRLCGLAELEDREALFLAFGRGPAAREIFLMAREGSVLAYVNDCPHRHLPLNFHPDKVLDVTGERILCTNHIALFRILDGYCEEGPCKGQYLTPVAIRVEAGEVLAG